MKNIFFTIFIVFFLNKNILGMNPQKRYRNNIVCFFDDFEEIDYDPIDYYFKTKLKFFNNHKSLKNIFYNNKNLPRYRSKRKISKKLINPFTQEGHNQFLKIVKIFKNKKPYKNNLKDRTMCLYLYYRASLSVKEVVSLLNKKATFKSYGSTQSFISKLSNILIKSSEFN